MRFHDAATLQRLRALADRHDLLLIFDEIFTGFGRAGTLFACETAAVVPDIVTLSKALTGGTLPLAATVASRSVFEAFWSDDAAKALMHASKSFRLAIKPPWRCRLVCLMLNYHDPPRDPSAM